MRKSLNIPRKE